VRRDNQFTAFPPSVILSPALTHLNISRNALTAISYTNPVHPNPDLLQSRAENSFFDSFPSTPSKSPFRDSDTEEVMPSCKTLDLSDNRITGAGLPDRWPRGVEVVDLSRNRLEAVVDLSVFARLPRLKRLVLSGNGITGVVVREGEGLWPCLECLDFEGCELTSEEELVRALKLPRGWTTGDATQGAVQIVSFDF
jgi:Leucine-rich repeat (LRR) protein